jgi:glycosyltransferase involved in cell wall biosynthesis
MTAVGDQVAEGRGAGDGAGNLLHVVTDDDRRGAQVFAHELGRELASRGVAVRTVALRSGETGGLPFAPLGPSRLHPRTLASLRAEMRGARVTVGFGSSTLPACTLAGGRPFVYRSIGELHRWTTTSSKRWRSGIFLRRADGVIALWHAARERLIDDHGLDPSRVVVIPRGVSASGFPEVDAERRRRARASLALDPEAPVLVALGALAPEKRLTLAIELVRHLPDVHLVLGGSGPMDGELRDLAGRVAPHRVHFVGQVGDVVPLLHAADAVVLTSTTEGMPGVVIEAGLAGIPAIATAVGAVPEMVQDRRTGAIVSRDPQIDELVAATEAVLRDGPTMGPAARAHCLEHFELGAVARRWEEALDAVVRR